MALIGIAVLLLQSVLIFLLILQIQKRKRADQTIRRLTRRLIHAGEEERMHLARELHDDIGQRLSLVSVELDSLNLRCVSGHEDEERTEDGDPMLADTLDELRTVISDVHNLSHRLHSSKLEHLGLGGALKELCQQIAMRREIQLDLRVDENCADLPPDLILCFYRVAQEALNNVVKHSSATRVAVNLVVTNGCIRLQVNDNGPGFDSSKTLAGLGMVTMEERVRMVGGKLSVTSKPGIGTIVIAQVSQALLKHQGGRGARTHFRPAGRRDTLTDEQV